MQALLNNNLCCTTACAAQQLVQTRTALQGTQNLGAAHPCEIRIKEIEKQLNSIESI